MKDKDEEIENLKQQIQNEEEEVNYWKQQYEEEHEQSVIFGNRITQLECTGGITDIDLFLWKLSQESNFSKEDINKIEDFIDYYTNYYEICED